MTLGVITQGRPTTRRDLRAARFRHLVRLFLLRAWLPVLLVIIWWFGSQVHPSLYFPSLPTIWDTLLTDWLGPGLQKHLLPSLVKFIAGFAIAAVVGIVVGLILGVLPVARAVLEPVMQFLRSLPPPVLLPVGVLLFGIGAPMNIAIIAFGSVWPTLLNTIEGVRSVDGEVEEMGRSYRLTAAQNLRYIVLPHAAPQIFAGLRTSLQISIILIVVSEMVASTNGIGFYLLNSQQTFEVPETWAGTLLLGIIGYLATLVFNQVEKVVLAWYRLRLKVQKQGA